MGFSLSGMLAGVGEGLQKSSGILERQYARDFQANESKLQYQRQEALTNLKAKLNAESADTLYDRQKEAAGVDMDFKKETASALADSTDRRLQEKYRLEGELESSKLENARNAAGKTSAEGSLNYTPQQSQATAKVVNSIFEKNPDLKGDAWQEIYTQQLRKDYPEVSLARAKSEAQSAYKLKEATNKAVKEKGALYNEIVKGLSSGDPAYQEAYDNLTVDNKMIVDSDPRSSKRLDTAPVKTESALSQAVETKAPTGSKTQEELIDLLIEKKLNMSIEEVANLPGRLEAQRSAISKKLKGTGLEASSIKNEMYKLENQYK